MLETSSETYFLFKTGKKYQSHGICEVPFIYIHTVFFFYLISWLEENDILFGT